ncbi:hypothetical protein ETQ85_24450 [Zoogloea oleivorans]|uniref:Uncharacterized protein n=1 Tax=Zoogloea oleivorans TaxID=1552750 RepID=A0A6C2CCY9_9RHOO|nr:hypothetical protein [Zoogloea oleivorans]TYC51379.1 hypothetical protein ETQ85_24450 [Zoogloea oleivorans]
MAKEKSAAAIKDELFEDFFDAAWNTFMALESQFRIKGVMDQVFGVDADLDTARENLRKSPSWQTLIDVYEYAYNGVEPKNGGPEDIVIDGSDVLKLVTSENYWPCAAWDNIISMADGRFGLDEGSPIDLYKVALLANVDIRTVRNAVSAGELISFKSSDEQRVLVESASARRWLLGRRGFKSTLKSLDGGYETIDTIKTPAAFGAFLKHQRERLKLDDKFDKLIVMHPSATIQALEQLESGVFSLPLDAVFPVADFYELDRKEFLLCVMRVFFYEEMEVLSKTNEVTGG